MHPAGPGCAMRTRRPTDGGRTDRWTETDRLDEANSYFRSFAKEVRIVENIRAKLQVSL